MTRKMPSKSPGAERQVAAYIRVSTQRQKTEGDSLEAQQNEINRYLKNREQFKGWTIKSICPYIDAGRSAKNQNRPQLQKLRADIAKGEIDTVVCFKLDRITRSILDFADLWDFFKKHGVEFISLNEDVDSSTAMGRAMLAIIMVFAQLEREITGERTLATMQDRLTWGDMVRDDCHEPIISKEQFDRVQRILDDTTKHRTNRRKSRGRGYPLRGLVRCGCGAMMTPKGAHGRNAKYHYYECTRRNHVGPTGCRALGIPAEPLEEAVVARVAELGTNEAARRQVISEALKLIDASAHAADQEGQTVRNRLTTVKAEIGRLVAVLKEMGTGGLDGIKDELTRLEREKGELQARQDELQQQKSPVDQVMALAKTFIENWPGVGELIQEATGDERRGILEQYVEVVQMTPTGPDGKSGTYALRLFPEATPDRDAHGGVEPGDNHRANDDPVLTESSLVREVDEKAPRLGLEPRT